MMLRMQQNQHASQQPHNEAALHQQRNNHLILFEPSELIQRAGGEVEESKRSGRPAPQTQNRDAYHQVISDEDFRNLCKPMSFDLGDDDPAFEDEK